MSKILENCLIFLLVVMKVALGCDTPPCLVYATGNRINVLELATNRIQSPIYEIDSQPVAVDLDISRRHVYWSDREARSILRASLDGTGVETVVSNCGTTGGLAVDWISGHLYWTNYNHKRIGVSRLDGSDRSFIISSDLEKLFGLAVEPEEGLIFWSDFGSVPKIEKATLAGEYRKVLVGINIVHPRNLVIDYNANPKRLYWVDVQYGAVQSVELDGTNRKEIVQLDDVNIQHPFGITVNNENLYLTDWKTGSINVVDKGNGNFKKALQTRASGKVMAIMGIAIFDKSRQPQGSNACTGNKGGCSHLCLVNRNQQKCFCPDGVHLNSDWKTCSKLKGFLLIADTLLSMICTIPLDSTTQIVQRVVYKSKHSIEQPVAVDYHEDEDRIYWSDIGRKTISRAFLNGNGLEVLHNVEFVEGLAIDSISNTIFWSDRKKNVIESSRLDGSFRKVLFESFGLQWPRGLFVSVTDSPSSIYWTEIIKNPRIQRAKMDGSSIKVLIDLQKDASPNSLVLYPSKGMLYFTESELGQIVSYDLKSKEQKILNKQTVGFNRLNDKIKKPYGLAIDHEYLYWTDWTTKAVYGAKRETGEEPKILVEYLKKPMGIKASFGQKSGSSSPTIFCPSYYEIYNKNEHSSLTHYVRPAEVRDHFLHSPKVQCSPSEISITDYGEHKVECTAKTINGNFNCSYRIGVKNHLCSRLSPPVNGQVNCKTYCTVTCHKDFVLGKTVTEKMDCIGARWRPGQNRNINLLPVCLPKRSPTRIKLTSKIAFKKICENLNEKETIWVFNYRLKELINNAQEAKHILVIFEIRNVFTACSQKGYWLTTKLQSALEIHFTLVLDLSISQVDAAFNNPTKTLDTIKNILFEKVNDETFTLHVDTEMISAFKNSFTGSESAECSSMELAKSSYCLKCAHGMYFNKTSRECEPCPMGFYQDEEGKTSCQKCPNNSSTVVMGTDTRLGCHDHKDISVTFSVEITKIDSTKLKDAIVGFVNKYCGDEKNNCPVKSNENTKSYSPTENLEILPSDVVIPQGFPRDLKQGHQLVVLFVVVSLQDNKPEFFPSKHLNEILNLYHSEMRQILGGDVTFNPGKNKTNSDVPSDSNGTTISLAAVVTPVVFGIILPLMAFICYKWYRSYKGRRAAELQFAQHGDNNQNLLNHNQNQREDNEIGYRRRSSNGHSTQEQAPEVSYLTPNDTYQQLTKLKDIARPLNGPGYGVYMFQTEADIIRCEVLYDFNGRNEDETTVRAGEELVVIEVDDGNTGGWTRVLKGEDTGIVPTTYIELIE